MSIATRDAHAPPDMFGLALPHDLDAEKALLGSMFFKAQVIEPVASIVRVQDFHSAAHGIIFKTIVALSISSKPDAVLVYHELKGAGLDQEIGGLAYLIEIAESVPHAANAEHYAKIVRERSLRREAIRRARDIMLRAADDGEDPTALVAEAARLFETIGRSASTESRFKVLDMAELATADHRVNYLVEGQPCIIGGPQKALKTCMALALFLALATGGMFLGKFRVSRRCRTLLLSGESGLATIQETLHRIADAAGYNLADVEGLHVCSTIPRLDREEDLAELRGIIRQHEIQVIGIDPIYLCMPSTDTSNLFAQGELLRRVGELCETERCMPILLHHAKKGAGINFDPIELADLSYSGFAEFARQWLLIGRREKYLPGTGDHRLWLTVGGSAGHNSLWAVDVSEGAYTPGSPRIWDVAVRPPDEVRKDDREQQAVVRAEKRKEKRSAEIEAAKKDVIRYLVKLKTPDTYRGIRTGTALSDSLLKLAIAALLDLEPPAIVKVDVQKHTRTEEGYALPGEGKTNE